MKMHCGKIVSEYQTKQVQVPLNETKRGKSLLNNRWQEGMFLLAESLLSFKFFYSLKSPLPLITENQLLKSPL